LDLQTTTEQRRAERGRRRAHHDGETKRSTAGERLRDDEPRGFGGAVRASLGSVEATTTGTSPRDLNTNGRNEHAGWTCGDEGVEEKSGKWKKET
jgi:hypothetical protein